MILRNLTKAFLPVFTLIFIAQNSNAEPVGGKIIEDGPLPTVSPTPGTQTPEKPQKPIPSENASTKGITDEIFKKIIPQEIDLDILGTPEEHANNAAIDKDFRDYKRAYPYLSQLLTPSAVRSTAENNVIRLINYKNQEVQSRMMGLQKHLEKLHKQFRRFYLLNAIKATEHNYPEIYKASLEIAETLGLGSDFNVFIGRTNQLNAYTIGSSTQSFDVFIDTDAVEQMTYTQLKAVIAHEMGHIADGILIYKLLFSNITGLADAAPVENGLTQNITDDQAKNLALALASGSEITADRIGMIATGNKKSALESLIVSGFGRRVLYNFDFSIENYFEQLREGLNGVTSDDMTFLTTLAGDHPLYAFRIYDLYNYGDSDSFKFHKNLFHQSSVEKELDLLKKLTEDALFLAKDLQGFVTQQSVSPDGPTPSTEADAMVKTYRALIQERTEAALQLAALVLLQIEGADLTSVFNDPFDALIKKAKLDIDGVYIGVLFDFVENKINSILQKDALPKSKKMDQIELNRKLMELQAVRTQNP